MATSAQRFADETEALFSNIPYRPPTRATSRPSNKLTAAEQEWLQEENASSSLPLYFADPDHRTERFDWRLRAPSRIRKDPDITKQRARYVRRKLPPLVTVMQGEPFYDAIQAYQDRYAKYTFAFNSRLTIF